MDDPPPPAATTAPARNAARLAREAEALRANLRKRKEQTRQRTLASNMPDQRTLASIMPDQRTPPPTTEEPPAGEAPFNPAAPEA